MRLHATLFLIVSLLFAFCGCSPSGETPDALKQTPVETTPAVEPQGPASATDTRKAPFDVASVVRQVQLSFKRSGAGFSARNQTIESDLQAGVLSVSHLSVGDEGKPIEGATLMLRTSSARRGSMELERGGVSAVDAEGSAVAMAGVVREKLRNDEAGVEQSWNLAERPAGEGDLEVRVRVAGMDFTSSTDSGLHFFDRQSGRGFRYGHGTWVDAGGRRTEVQATYQDGDIVLRVPAALVNESSYPAVLDPTVSAEFGTDDPVLSPAYGGQAAVELARGGNQYLLVWSDDRGGPFAARVALDGTVLDPTGIPVDVASGDRSPKVAFDGTNWMVVWSRYGNSVFGARIDSSGTVVDSTPIALVSGGGQQPSIVFNGSQYSVIYDKNQAGLYLIQVTVSGQVVTPSPILIKAKDVNYPGFGKLRLYNNGAMNLVVWNRPTTSGQSAAYAVRVNSAGVVLDSTPILFGTVSPSEEFGVASDGTNFLIASCNDTDVQVRLLSSTGALGTTASFKGCSPDVVFDPDGNYSVIYTNNNQLFGARVGVSGGVLQSAIPVASGEPGNRSHPRIATDGTNLLTAFEDLRYYNITGNSYDIFSARFAPGFTQQGTSKLVSGSANQQKEPSVAFNGTNYLVAWTDDRSVTPSDIWATRITPDGTVLDPAGIVITQAVNEQHLSSVASNGTDWLVVWDDRRLSRRGVYGARVTAGGTNLDPAGLKIHDDTGTDQANARVVSDGSSYLVLYLDSAKGLVGKYVSATGTTTPTPFLVEASAYAYDIAFNGTNYLVAWTTIGSIQAKRVGTIGGAIDPTAIPISQSPSPDSAAVAVASNGSGWLIAWASSNSSGYDLVAARVSGSGVLQDAFPIDVAAATNSQRYPAAAWDGLNYWVVWEDNRLDTNLTDIYGARIGSTGTVLDPGGFAIAADGVTSETKPVATGWRDGRMLVFYQRLDLTTPINALRVKGRIVGDVGFPCGSQSDCEVGYCVDGVCCNTQCGGTCEACTTAKKGSGPDGICAPVGLGSDPDNECADQGSASCGTDGSCNGAGACRTYAAGTSCGAPSCSAGQAITRTCDGSGTCSQTAQDCGLYSCVAGACKDPCSTSSDCTAGSWCDAGTCKTQAVLGASCSSGGSCASGFCVDGVCCDSSCTGTCNACSATKKGGGVNGQCGPIAASTDPDNECAQQGANTCGQTGTCDGAGACGLYDTATVCSPASCTGTTQKSASLCDGNGACVPGASQACVLGYRCESGSCATGCTATTGCASGYSCVGGACIQNSGSGGTGGMGGSAGSTAGGTGGTAGAGTGGTTVGGSGGTGGGAGGSLGSGGVSAGGTSSGGTSTGGTSSVGGASGTGGSDSAGGNSGSAGTAGNNGTGAVGGIGQGGTGASSGAGAANTGGNGNSAGVAGGAAGAGGSFGGTSPGSGASDSCSCRAPGSTGSRSPAVIVPLLGLLMLRRRWRRVARAAARCSAVSP